MGKRLLAVAVFMMFTTAMPAVARDAPLVSAAQFQKIQKVLDTAGVKTTFPAPTAQNLRLSKDPGETLDVVQMMTSDHMVYFCRSLANPADFILWVRAGEDASYMFSTQSDFKPIAGMYLRIGDFPQEQDVSSPNVLAVYEHALSELAKDVDRAPAQ
jgi:hypothetical protein